jgi:hypothetical protein
MEPEAFEDELEERDELHEPDDEDAESDAEERYLMGEDDDYD